MKNKRGRSKKLIGSGGGGGGSENNRPRNGSCSNGGSCWTGEDHATRDASLRHRRRQRRHKSSNDDGVVVSERERRRAALTHETPEKRNRLKLRLHLTKTQREIDQLRGRLEKWDPVEEANKVRLEEAAAKRKREEEAELGSDTATKRKRKRKGPETWKLKGAARPAREVYDFDTRYVDPHIRAHEEAREKARRSVNLLSTYRGSFGREEDDQDRPPACREYLGLLMQLGHLRRENGQYQQARAAWLEVIELEGDDHPVTTARESLMRMYMQLNRIDSAFRLGERLEKEPSVWIRYSMALVAFRKRPDKEDQQQHDEKWMVRAIRSNPLCAYYLAFYDTFASVIEYTDDIDDAEDEPQSSLEEAIEYCCTDQAKVWVDSGASLALKEILLRAICGGHEELGESDVDWKDRLSKIEEAFHSRTAGNVGGDDEDIHDEQVDTGNAIVDVPMFAGMFRTAMEMLQDSGEVDLKATAAQYMD